MQHFDGGASMIASVKEKGECEDAVGELNREVGGPIVSMCIQVCADVQDRLVYGAEVSVSYAVRIE